MLLFESCMLLCEPCMLLFESCMLLFEPCMLLFESCMLLFEPCMLLFESCMLLFEPSMFVFDASILGLNDRSPGFRVIESSSNQVSPKRDSRSKHDACKPPAQPSSSVVIMSQQHVLKD